MSRAPCTTVQAGCVYVAGFANRGGGGATTERSSTTLGSKNPGGTFHLPSRANGKLSIASAYDSLCFNS